MRNVFLFTGLHPKRYYNEARDSIMEYNPDATCLWIPGKGMSFTRAMNVGTEMIVQLAEPDWIFYMDDDVICTGEIDTRHLQTNAIYGNTIKEKWNIQYLEGWIMAVPLLLAVTIKFDEGIKASGFEDFDYCMQAKGAGYTIQRYDFLFDHLRAGEKRQITKNYGDVRRKNIEYVERKWKL